MTGTIGRRCGPWLTPVLVAAEIALVWSGLLGVGRAILVAVAIEALLALTALSRGVAALRRFRAGRAATGGEDGWAAAEDALAQLLPRPAARALLIEARLWLCLLRWMTGRHDGTSARAHFYSRQPTTLLVAMVALTIVEGALVELVLAVTLPATPWPWVALGLHGYAIIWIAGVLASLHTCPHLLDTDALRVRDGVFAELTVPYSAITGARRIRQPGPFRSGFTIEPTGRATLAWGDATVELALDGGHVVRVTGRSPEAMHALSMTVDDADAFLSALAARLAACQTPTR